MKLAPYPEYKDSGVPWIDRIPKAWNFLRGKNLFDSLDTRSETGTEELLSVSEHQGVTPRRSVNVTMFQAASYQGYKLCWPGDLVINSLWAWMQGLGFSRYHGIISTAYGVYRPRKENVADFRYFDYLLRSAAYKWELRVRSKGIWRSRYQLKDDDFLTMPILIPVVGEQIHIAHFLDWKSAQINKFIRNKRRLIELLKEQKQNIINQAVTRGIDPDVKLKPSGVEWIRDIPEHWEVRRIKTVTKILRGKFSYRPRNDASLYDGVFPFIQTGDVARAGKYITKYRQSLNEKGFSVSKQFPKGTLTMTIAANIGDVAILDFDACFPDSIVGFIPNKGVLLEFLYYAFTAMKKEFLKQAPVNTQGNLNIERIGAMSIVLPDIEEQQLLVDKIESLSEQFDQTITRTEREIELMREYRTRLISDVVTGQVDVRGVEVPDVAGDNLAALDESDDGFEESEMPEIEENIEE